MTEKEFTDLANKHLTVLESYQLDKEGNKQFNIFGYKQLFEALNYTLCCTELPNKMVIELSDEEMQIVSKDELIQMEKEAMEFDGFEGWTVRGKAAVLK